MILNNKKDKNLVNMIKGKKSISSIVAAILLILITIAAFTILAAFIMPMIKNNLNKSGLCYNTLGKLSVSQDEYTCTNNVKTLIKIDRKISDNIIVKSLIFSISSGGNAERFEIVNGTPTTNNIKMYDNAKTILIIPNSGESQTYNFTIGNAESVRVAPVLEGGISCDEIFEQITNECLNK